MQNNNLITLYQSTRLKENKEATELIKRMLIKFKDQHSSFNYAVNSIIEHFDDLEKEHITSRSDLKFLLNVFDKGKRNYEKGMSLLVIPEALKTRFEEIENLDISFNEYIIHLARRISYSRASDKFQSNYNLFEAMYITGKFDGYKNLQEFDVRFFNRDKNYKELKKEVLDFAYSKENNHSEKDKTTIKKNPPFTFHREYIEAMKSEKVYSRLVGDYFNDREANYNKYLNVFFEDPYHHNFHIQLDCNTQLFAKLLDEMKTHIFKNVSYQEIEKNKLFKTKFGKNLTGNNISKSAYSSSETEDKIVNSTITYIKEVSAKLKC